MNHMIGRETLHIVSNYPMFGLGSTVPDIDAGS